MPIMVAEVWVAEFWQMIVGGGGIAVIFGYLGKAWEARRKAKIEDEASRRKAKMEDEAASVAGRKDALTEWQEYAQKLEGDVAKRDAELVSGRAEILRLNSIIGQLKIQRESYRGRVGQLETILDLQHTSSDPFLVHQAEMRPMAYFLTEPDGTITHAGQNIMAILDYEDHQLVGQNVARLIPAAYREAHKAFMDRARDMSIPLDPKNVLPLVFIARGRREQPVNVRIRRREENGKVERFVVLIQERDLDGFNGNGGSQSGDSGAFLKAGAPEANRATAEMPQVTGAPAKGEGAKGD